MTGFGDASMHANGVHYFLEVRSLNNKYFKATIRLPENLQGLEPELESQLRRRLVRGSIVLVGRCSDSSEDAAYEINAQALGRYIEQLRRTPQIADGSCSFDLGPLLGLPGVLQPPADEESRLEHAREGFLKLLDTAIGKLVEMRAREGELLSDELMTHHDAIMERLHRIESRAPKVIEDYQARLQGRIEAMLEEAQVKVEPMDLIREVAVFADRSDIAEELARLAGHMSQFESLLNRDDDRPMGRTLDFLAQEMLREANTIASKSGDAEISRDIVEIKGAIDRIKEQVQNVE
ncbi:MAG: YicC/YloC family endoribonuclease [Phycisphaerales bacterium]